MKTIPYGHQSISADDIRAVAKVLKSDWLTQGPVIKRFEDALCDYTDAKFAVCVSSGTAALQIACMAAGIKPKDEVITSPITFVASANCALYCGARPVFADIQPDTVNIDPSEIRKKLTKKTKAVIPVHFAGHPCDMDETSRIARKNGLIVIEDAAHALGAEYRNSRIGSCRYSDMAIFSFHPVKAITTGEGGAIMTNSKKFYDRLIMLRNHGITKKNLLYGRAGGWYYEMQALSFNYRITDIQAALGVSQLKKLGAFISARRKIAGIYDRAFRDNPYFDIPVEREGSRAVYHLYPIRLKEKFRVGRKDIFEKLKKMALGVQVHYMPVYLHPYYRRNFGFTAGLCPASEYYYSRAISLPIYPAMTGKEIKRVIDTIFEVLNGYE